MNNGERFQDKWAKRLDDYCAKRGFRSSGLIKCNGRTDESCGEFDLDVIDRFGNKTTLGIYVYYGGKEAWFLDAYGREVCEVRSESFDTFTADLIRVRKEPKGQKVLDLAAPASITISE